MWVPHHFYFENLKKKIKKKKLPRNNDWVGPTPPNLLLPHNFSTSINEKNSFSISKLEQHNRFLSNLSWGFVIEAKENRLSSFLRRMEEILSSRSPLKGAQGIGQRLVIYFSYGGQYLKKGEDIIWCAREDVHHALLMTKSDAELTYEVLVEKIISKMVPNEANSEIKLSYFPVGVDPSLYDYVTCNT